MMDLVLRPDLKTAGGEVHDILLSDRYVGTLSIVFREMERLAGSVQLDQESLSPQEKTHVLRFISQYVQGLAGALSVIACEVFVTYSSFETIVSTSNEVAARLDSYDLYEGNPDDGEEMSEDDFEAEADEELDEDFFRLDFISAGRNVSVYEINDREQEVAAVAIMKQYGADMIGEVRWDRVPQEREIDFVTELLVRDLDDSLMDTIVIDMKVGEDIIQTIELTHEDLLDDDAQAEWLERAEPTLEFSVSTPRLGYSIEAVRDDGDVLTFALYHEKRGAIPVGMATVDIDSEELTGFIDLDIPGAAEDRAQMATLLMRELDKTVDYDSLNLTLLYKNEKIDEMMFENEMVD